MRKGRKENRPLHKPHLATLMEYIAKGNPKGIRKLAYLYGYPTFQTYEGSLRFLRQFLKAEGEKGLDDLMMQHPDKEIILEIYFTKHPQRISFNSFTGTSTPITTYVNSTDKKALLDALGVLVAERKEQVVTLLRKHGTPVSDSTNVEEISDKLIQQIQRNDENFNLDLSAEIFALHKGEEKDFVPFVGAIATGIGKIAGGLFNNAQNKANAREEKRNNASAITMAALNYKLASKQQQNVKPPAKDKTQLWVLVGVGGSVLVMIVIIIFLFLNSKAKTQGKNSY